MRDAMQAGKIAFAVDLSWSKLVELRNRFVCNNRTFD